MIGTHNPLRTSRRCGRSARLNVSALLKQAPGLPVSWRQTVDTVLVDVPVAPEVRGRDVKLDVHPTRLSLTLDGQPLLAGSLTDCGSINVDDCFWTLETETGPDGKPRKWVALTLGKRMSGYNSWDCLLESERVDMTITDRCFLEVEVGGQPAGTVAVGLFGNAVPRTAANFKALCTGEKGMGSLGKPLTYKGSSFHRIIPGFMAQGGDITANNGTGGESIYGPQFEDENFRIKHEEAGYLAMANAGPNTNTSQFYVLYGPTPHLDGKHVVFGKVLAGMDVMRRLEAIGSSSGTPSQPVTIVDAGVLEDDKAVEDVMDANKALQLQKDDAEMSVVAEAMDTLAGQ